MREQDMNPKFEIDARAVTYLTLIFVMWLCCLGALIRSAL